jgi:hypothetical protein
MPHKEVKDPILNETYGIYDLELAFKQLDDPSQCLEIATTMISCMSFTHFELIKRVCESANYDSTKIKDNPDIWNENRGEAIYKEHLDIDIKIFDYYIGKVSNTYPDTFKTFLKGKIQNIDTIRHRRSINRIKEEVEKDYSSNQGCKALAFWAIVGAIIYFVFK